MARPPEAFIDGKLLAEVRRTEQSTSLPETDTVPVMPRRGSSSAYCGQDVPAIDVSLLMDMDPAVKPERVGTQAAVP